MSEPWHYTTALDFLDHWQALSAGLIGFAAAIIVVFVTLQIERRKINRETEALRKSLGVELRMMIARSWGAYQSLRNLTLRKNTKITSRMVSDLSRVPVPIIFPASADKIGLLGPDAMDLLIVYTLIDVARDGIKSLQDSRTPDDLQPNAVATIADAFLAACKHAPTLLPKLRTGDPIHDEKDKDLIDEIRVASAT